MGNDRPEKRARVAALFRGGATPPQIAEIMGTQSPAVYKMLRTTGDLPPYKPLEAHDRRRGTNAAKLTASVPKVELVRVNRDPCTRCATRADIGCAHQPPRAPEPLR